MAAVPRLETQNPKPMPPWLWLLALTGLVVGAISLAKGLSASNPAPGWQALFINFLFWTSLAQGALAWSVAFRIARTTWSAAVNRLGHAMLWYLPFCLLVFAFLYLGRTHFMPCLCLHLGYRQRWLNAPNLFARDGGLLLVTVILSWLYVRTYLRFDYVAAGRRPPEADWRGEGEEAAHVNRRLSLLGVALLYSYVLTFTLLGFDLVMALQPVWHSALFGWYFTLGSAYAGIAALAVLMVVLRGWLGAPQLLDHLRRRYVGNLLLAFAMLMTYFFYSQAMPIWYENLPYEIPYAIPRVHLLPWRTLSWVLLFTAYLGVFALLVVREMKEIPATLCGVALLALGGMWLERYLEVAPSLNPQAALSPALVVTVGLGFLGVFILTTGLFLARHPAASPLDEVLLEEREQWQ